MPSAMANHAAVQTPKMRRASNDRIDIFPSLELCTLKVEVKWKGSHLPKSRLGGGNWGGTLSVRQKPKRSRPRCCLRTAADAQLAVNFADVPFDGSARQIELIGDFLIGIPFGN